MVEKDVANLKTNLQHFGYNVDIRCLFLKDFVKEDQFTETIRLGFSQSTLLFFSASIVFVPSAFVFVWLHQCLLSSYEGSHSLQHFY